jgi:hypothetical protein
MARMSTSYVVTAHDAAPASRAASSQWRQGRAPMKGRLGSLSEDARTNVMFDCACGQADPMSGMFGALLLLMQTPPFCMCKQRKTAK